VKTGSVFVIISPEPVTFRDNERLQGERRGCKLKRRPLPRKKRGNRPEPDPKRKLRDLTDKKTKKYGPIFAILEEEEIEEPEGLEEMEGSDEIEEA
jgi:hypothetical protein